MFEINGTLVIFVASFLMFMTLLNEVMLKPVGRVIEKRHEKMQNDLAAARSAREQAAQLVEGYESDLKKIRGEAHSIISTSMSSANKSKAEELARVHKEGLEKLDRAKTEIAAERTTLIDELVAHERELVEEITQKILGEPVAVHLDASKVRKNLEET